MQTKLYQGQKRKPKPEMKNSKCTAKSTTLHLQRTSSTLLSEQASTFYILQSLMERTPQVSQMAVKIAALLMSDA